MDLITELDSEFSEPTANHSPSFVQVRFANGLHQLRLPQLGLDYLAGLANGSVLVIPLSKIVQLECTHLPARTEQSMLEFLQRQRTPIRIQLATDSSIGSCWLLNVEGEWLRVAIAQGLSWVPLAAIQSLEIQAVDNSNH